MPIMLVLTIVDSHTDVQRLCEWEAHLAAVLDLLAALAKAGEVHLALTACVVLLKLRYLYTCHVVCLRIYPDKGLQQPGGV